MGKVFTVGAESNWVPCEQIMPAIQKRLDEGFSLTELAWFCGFIDQRKIKRHEGSGGDLTRLKRALGIAPNPDHNGGYSKPSGFMHYKTAVRIVRGLGLDPVDYGI